MQEGKMNAIFDSKKKQVVGYVNFSRICDQHNHIVGYISGSDVIDSQSGWIIGHIGCLHVWDAHGNIVGRVHGPSILDAHNKNVGHCKGASLMGAAGLLLLLKATPPPAQ